MIHTRAAKVAGIANDIPEQAIDGPDSGELLVLSWGGTYGACATAVHRAQAAGKSVSHAHLRYLNPFPRNLGDLMKRFDKVLVPELNCGQLLSILRSTYLIDAVGYNKVQGKPFSVEELERTINKMVD